MIAIQLICDRLALATGRSLGVLAMRHFDRFGMRLVGGMLIALFVAYAMNVSADLAAVGQGMHLRHLGPPAVWALIAGGAVTTLLLFGTFTLSHTDPAVRAGSSDHQEDRATTRAPSGAHCFLAVPPTAMACLRFLNFPSCLCSCIVLSTWS